MTSNANTSGHRSEIAQMVCGYWLKRGKHTASDRAWNEALETADRILSVTAASAQAAIDAERATKEAAYERIDIEMARATAAEARVEMLEGVLGEIRDLGSDGEHSGDRHARCRSIARAALQQEPTT